MPEPSRLENSNTAYDAETLAFYSAQAPVYTASGPQGASRHLGGFLDRLKSGSCILELGCGGGRDAEAMIRRGFIVDATDGTPEMARLAEQRIGQPVRVLRFDQLDEDGKYDAVWAHASLLHVPLTKLPRILGLVHRALRPGGFHMASFKTAGIDGRDRFGRYFNQPDLPKLIDLYRRSAPWDLVETEEYIGGGYGRSEGPWSAITVRKT